MDDDRRLHALRILRPNRRSRQGLAIGRDSAAGQRSLFGSSYGTPWGRRDRSSLSGRCRLEYHAQFLESFFGLGIQALKANNLSLCVFDQHDPMAYFLADLLTLRVIPVDGEGFLITAYPCDRGKEGDRIWPI